MSNIESVQTILKSEKQNKLLIISDAVESIRLTNIATETPMSVLRDRTMIKIDLGTMATEVLDQPIDIWNEDWKKINTSNEGK